MERPRSKVGDGSQAKRRYSVGISDEHPSDQYWLVNGHFLHEFTAAQAPVIDTGAIDDAEPES
jgi:hypothetical protein